MYVVYSALAVYSGYNLYRIAGSVRRCKVSLESPQNKMFVGCNIRISKPHLPRALVKYRCMGVYPSFNICVNVILIVHTHTILTVFFSAVAIIIVTVVVCLIGDIIMKAPGANASMEKPI